MTVPPILIDTNILIYLYDQNQPDKQNQSKRVLEQLELTRSGRLSVQALAEFFSVAGRGVRDHKLSYYDAQVWATARLNQVPVVFSEDFRDGSILEGVRFVNPFSPKFLLEKWF